MEDGYEKDTADVAQPAGTEKATGDKPEVDQSVKALVEQWTAKINAAKKHHAPKFKEMRDSQDFAMRGATKAWKDAGNYTVPILPRYINQAVSTLYAKNPKTVFERKKRLKYKIWDGRKDTLDAALEMAAMGDMQAQAILQELIAVRQEDMLLDRMGETLQIAWEYYLNEQSANYKQQLKAAVRRAKVCKVAYIKLGFQRAMELRPESTAKINDITSKIASIESTLHKIEGDKLDEQNAEMAQLKNNLADVEADKMVLVREGPVLDFPKSDAIIIDPACTHLKSLTGAKWLAHEFEFNPDDIFKIWKKDVSGEFKAYASDGKAYSKKADREKQCGKVWVVEDKENLQTFAICEGYCDFLKPPATPDVWMERFWSIFPIVFNEVEHYEEIYPNSDVEQATDIQKEYNRSREELRQHRIAAAPWWVEGAGLSDAEKQKLAQHSPHEVVSLPTLQTGQDINKILQAGPTAKVDMNLYEVEMHFNDLLRVVGYQEAQIGAASGSTATEASIGQQSQATSSADNTDDIDEVLTELARAGGQVMLLNLEKETIIEIVGEGAVWPDTPTTREAAAKEIMLQAKAGSTGRPNRAAELANMERGMPMLQNLPGVNPTPLAERYLELLEIDVEGAITEGMPSITAMNAIMAKAGMAAGGGGAAPTGDPATDPASQGPQGASNAPNPQQNEPGPQPAYTPPMPA